MKRTVVWFSILLFAIMLVTLIPPKSNADYLRIHIRADSNDTNDQNVKYLVKTAVVDYLTPYLVNVYTKSDAYALLNARMGGIEEVCNKVLEQNGFGYKAHCRLATELFPDRTYNGFTLEKGVYDALIVELGSGKGDNWWCVVYPPLCFLGGEGSGTSIVFRSKIMEVIRAWQSNLHR